MANNSSNSSNLLSYLPWQIKVSLKLTLCAETLCVSTAFSFLFNISSIRTVRKCRRVATPNAVASFRVTTSLPLNLTWVCYDCFVVVFELLRIRNYRSFNTSILLANNITWIYIIILQNKKKEKERKEMHRVLIYLQNATLKSFGVLTYIFFNEHKWLNFHIYICYTNLMYLIKKRYKQFDRHTKSHSGIQIASISYIQTCRVLVEIQI